MAAPAARRVVTRAVPAPLPAPAPVQVVAPAGLQRQPLRVSSPSDPAEKEAASTARTIVGMPIPVTSPFVARFSGAVAQRAAEGRPDVGGNVAAELTSSLSSGSPLPAGVRRFMEPRFGADFSRVRIHTGDQAARLNRRFGAQAFALGQHIFFGPNRFRPETSDGRELIAHELTHTIQQGAVVQRGGGAPPLVSPSPDTTIGQRVEPHVQRLGIGDALDFFAGRANLIPGFRLFTLVLGVNPVTMNRVERSAANIMRAVVEFLPGGVLVTQALDRYGVFDRAGTWVGQQLNALAVTGAAVRDAILRFLDSLSWTDIFNLGAVWDRARRIVTDPVDRIVGLVRGLITGILGFIREAVLRPLAGLAQATRGYDLIRVVLGRDPITGDPYPRTPENVIGAFMRLIGQEEKWRYLQESRAIPRAWVWFQAQLATLVGFALAVPTGMVRLLQSLQLTDLLNLPGVVARALGIYGSTVSRFVSWAAGAALQVMTFIFEVLAPGAMPVLRRAASVIQTIVGNPVGFVGNLVRAGLQGFRQFAVNILTHLVSGLVGWLTGALGGAGLQLPARWDLRGILSLVLQILGLTWQTIRQKLVRVIGEPAVRGLEVGFDLLMTLVREGPLGAWRQMLEGLQNLQEIVFGQIRDWVMRTIVTQAIVRIVSMLNPAGAVVQAIIAIYNTIMFFRERLQQIVQVAESFFDSVAQIATGAIGAAANRVEQTMARIVPVVISFLARLIGLGGISDTIRNIVTRIRAPIDRALDRVVDWIVAQARRLGRAIVGAVRGGARPAAVAATDAAGAPIRERRVSFGGEGHTLRARVTPQGVEYLMASDRFEGVTRQLDQLTAAYLDARSTLLSGPSRAAAAEGLRQRIGALNPPTGLLGRLRTGRRDSVAATDPAARNEAIDEALEELGTGIADLGEYMVSTYGAAFGPGAAVTVGSTILLVRHNRAVTVTRRGVLIGTHHNDVPTRRAGELGIEADENGTMHQFSYHAFGTAWAMAPARPAYQLAIGSGPGTHARWVVLHSAPVGGGAPPAVTLQHLAAFGPIYLPYVRRGHLLAEMFGGTGGWNNIVPMTYTANQSRMLSIEMALRNSLPAAPAPTSLVVRYTVVPLYAAASDAGSRLPPTGMDVKVEQIWPLAPGAGPIVRFHNPNVDNRT